LRAPFNVQTSGRKLSGGVGEPSDHTRAVMGLLAAHGEGSAARSY
jgi:hypothetical protein